LLLNIDLKNGVNQKSDVAKKSVELLSIFIEEFSNPLTRSVRLDKKIINQLLKFLLSKKYTGSSGGTQKNDMVTLDSSKREALLWLREFI
jgi:hypothetical protein